MAETRSNFDSLVPESTPLTTRPFSFLCVWTLYFCSGSLPWPWELRLFLAYWSPPKARRHRSSPEHTPHSTLAQQQHQESPGALSVQQESHETRAEMRDKPGSPHTGSPGLHDWFTRAPLLAWSAVMGRGSSFDPTSSLLKRHSFHHCTKSLGISFISSSSSFSNALLLTGYLGHSRMASSPET